MFCTEDPMTLMVVIELAGRLLQHPLKTNNYKQQMLSTHSMSSEMACPTSIQLVDNWTPLHSWFSKALGKLRYATSP